MTEGTIALDITVPSKWPPAATVELFSGAFNDTELKIFASPLGVLVFHLDAEQEQLLHVTPRLAIPDFAFLRVAFSWGRNEDARCAINGTLLGQGCQTDPIALDAKSHLPTGFRTPVKFQVPASCDAAEQSFLRFILDLQQRIAFIDRFNLLEASAILRRLLLDKSPVIHLVNRGHREKLRFPLTPERQSKRIGDGPTFQFVNLCPDFASQDELQYLTLDAFLQATAIYDHESAFTVRQIIDVCANIKGGVHFDTPSSQSQRSLVRLDIEYRPFLIDASLASLAGVSWTVIVACRPLIDAILRSRAE